MKMIRNDVLNELGERQSRAGRFRTVIMLVLGLLIVHASPALLGQSGDSGTITGQLVDAQTGDPLIGANVLIDGTLLGASTDLDGLFVVTGVPAGTYTIVVDYVGYAQTRIEAVEVKAGESARLSLAMAPEAIQGDVVVVEARLLENTDASLLKKRQKAAAVSDAISAEEISRSGSSDAADAMSRVTGASVVGGKYVYVRGLGDRYSNTQLNGAELPSADPDKKAVQMDLFPSNLLDNIVTQKTFTPDQPGNFSGGIVNIGTKSFPDGFTLKFSTTSSYNTRSTFSDNILTYPGGDLDWLGMDDGTRDIPDLLADPDITIPNVGEARNNAALAQELDAFSKAFNPVMAPTTRSGPVNQSYAFSVGNNISLFGRPLGYIGSISYSRKFDAYEDGEVGGWQLTGRVSETDSLKDNYRFSDRQGSEEVSWGGLATLAYKPHPGHEISLNYMHSQSGESKSRYLNGILLRDLSPSDTFETRVLGYTERNIRSFQLKGEHHLEDFLNMNIDWMGSLASSTQEEPDLRFFTDDYRRLRRNGLDTLLYTIRSSIYPEPTRYFRDLSEDSRSFNLKAAVPFKQWSGESSKLIFGGAYNTKDRTHRERRFTYLNLNTKAYAGDPAAYFAPENTGIIDTTNGRYTFGNHIADASEARDNYDGEEKVTAGFAMVELPLFRRLKLVTGARFEATRMDIISGDSTLAPGQLSNDDWLPSANLVYQLGQNMNLRAAYGKTLARPLFREKAPGYASFDFVGGFTFIGNGDLKRTLIDNYDLRWEWFSRPGEILALSGFHKRFQNPIERVLLHDNGEIQYQNVAEGTVSGLELEARKRLDVIHSLLGNFQIGGNLSVVRSEVNISEDELERIRYYHPEAKDTRELQGQSPYIVNLELAYDNYKTGTSAGIFYNVFGERLSEVSLGGTPNVFEQPRPELNLTLSQRVLPGLNAKFAAKNLLDSSVRKTHEFKGTEYVFRSYQTGRVYSLGLSYSVD